MKTLPDDIQPPSHYIEKVSLVTGEVQDDEILPKQLLVQSHRDYHVLDIYARYLISRGIRRTGDQDLVIERVKKVRSVGKKAVDFFSTYMGEGARTLGKKIFGYKEREYFFRFKSSGLSREEIQDRVAWIRTRAARRMASITVGGVPRLRVLLTGGTGFLGKEIIHQAASDPAVEEMIVLIRPKEIKDRKTKEVIRVVSPEERGQELLRQLWLEDHPGRKKFRFVDGDIEKPSLGLSEDERERLRNQLTHVIHCAASVSFDDTYENSYRANVLGSLNALNFSQYVHKAPDTRFVCHVSIETSYIHGRQTAMPASEDEIVFPRNFYNNFYEVTKAMGSLETDNFMIENGLPVTQLCPSIVVGHSVTGNNRGDTKVVNAPVNTFGRAKQALETSDGSFAERSKAYLIASLACVFPGDPSAELNIVPVDRVVMGILAALKTAQAVGERAHLATDNRVTSAEITTIAREEIEVDVKLAEPTLHRTITLPLLTKLLTYLKQPKLAGALKTLGTIFGSYSEWGQPVHEVGKDVTLLGLPLPRPNTQHVFRMLCRHNRYVQNFGQVRDLDEISRREKIWENLVARLQAKTKEHVGAMSPKEFRKELEAEVDPATFQPRKA